MPSYEEEAYTRAQQMHRRPQYRTENISKTNQKEEQKIEIKPEENNNNTAEIKQPHKNNQGDIFEILFKNKEQSLILLLIILLMDEKADPALLLALIYLLI